MLTEIFSTSSKQDDIHEFWPDFANSWPYLFLNLFRDFCRWSLLRRFGNVWVIVLFIVIGISSGLKRGYSKLYFRAHLTPAYLTSPNIRQVHVATPSPPPPWCVAHKKNRVMPSTRTKHLEVHVTAQLMRKRRPEWNPGTAIFDITIFPV